MKFAIASLLVSMILFDILCQIDTRCQRESLLKSGFWSLGLLLLSPCVCKQEQSKEFLTETIWIDSFFNQTIVSPKCLRQSGKCTIGVRSGENIESPEWMD
jgi:hypothetical protein